jgi:hypothetical protein
MSFADAGVPVYRIRTLVEERPVAGADSCIATVPPGLYVNVGAGPPALDARKLGRILRRLSNELAANIGETLHHADWVITDDPAVVEEVGMHGRPDCGKCRSGVDQALARLADRREDLLVGALYWAGPA